MTAPTKVTAIVTVAVESEVAMLATARRSCSLLSVCEGLSGAPSDCARRRLRKKLSNVVSV